MLVPTVRFGSINTIALKWCCLIFGMYFSGVLHRFTDGGPEMGKSGVGTLFPERAS